MLFKMIRKVANKIRGGDEEDVSYLELEGVKFLKLPNGKKIAYRRLISKDDSSIVIEDVHGNIRVFELNKINES